ncbi:hypothetical protein C8J57DRAFT_517721 [Mycena rebaudengoi]|nr:hypothetical protein C8J57DRAFT_517721 [Mycena rebaudengoi]
MAELVGRMATVAAPMQYSSHQPSFTSSSSRTTTIVINHTQQENQEPLDDQFTTLFCRALYDYEAQDASALSFHQNDIIEVLTQQPSGWWDGLLGDERGWFPSNYVTIISDEEAELAFSGSELSNPDRTTADSHLDSSSVLDMSHAVMQGSQAENEEWLAAEIDGSRGGLEELTNTALNAALQSSDFWMPERTRDLPGEGDDSNSDLADLTSQSSSRSGSTAGFGMPRRTGTPEPWVKKLADDGMSYYYYNTTDGTVQWTRPESESTHTRDRSLPSTTRTNSTNSIPTPRARTTPTNSQSTNSEDLDIQPMDQPDGLQATPTNFESTKISASLSDSDSVIPLPIDNGANVNAQVNVTNEEVGSTQETSLHDSVIIENRDVDAVDREFGSSNTASLNDSDSMVLLPIDNGANVNGAVSEIGSVNTASLSGPDSVVVIPIDNGHMLGGESAPGSEESSVQLFAENSAEGRDNITLFLRDVINQPDIALSLPVEDCRSWPAFRKWVLKQKMLGLSKNEASEFVVRLSDSRQILFESTWDGWITSLRYHPNDEIGVELCFVRDACQCVQPIDNGNAFCEKCGVQFLLEEPLNQAATERGGPPQEDKGEDNRTEEEGSGTAPERGDRLPGRNTMGKENMRDEDQEEMKETKYSVQVNRSHLNSVMRHRKPHLTTDEHQRHSPPRLDDASDDDKKLVTPPRRWACPRARDVVNSVTRLSNAVHEFVIAPPFLDGHATWDQKRLDTRLNALQGWAWPVHGVLLAAAVAILALSSISTYAVSQSFVILSGLFAFFGLIYTVLLIFLFGDRNIYFPKPPSQPTWNPKMLTLPLAYMAWAFFTLLCSLLSFGFQTFILDSNSHSPIPYDTTVSAASNPTTKSFNIFQSAVFTFVAGWSSVYIVLIFLQFRRPVAEAGDIEMSDYSRLPSTAEA